MRTSFRAAAVSAAVLLLSFVPGVAQADPSVAGGCRDIEFPVAQGSLATTLCLPDRPTGTVLVMMAGSNYNHTYWDFPYAPETYNFRRAMNAAGFATLVADRLGNGASTRPPSLSLTATATADALHGLVQALRAGFGGAQPFSKVVTAGHSLTSGTSVIEATTHHDVDGVLLTGYSHTLSIPDVLGVISTYHPAVEDPLFRDRGYDSGYLVTRPGARESDFHGPGNVDPQVLAVDEATKETFSLTEYPDGLTSTLPGMSESITAPVMIVNGGQDRLSCGPAFSICADTAALQAAEAPYFAPAARLRTYVLPGSGHSLNLALNTKDYQAAVIDWLRTI
ncbi:alpha/beta hydrolase [Nocardia huaxiensis]|uniref:alpha/beta hydrolase n=1 Tax=Nocardia huaxiensis TaxID=2755382 RepID=UPI001E6573BB|nr:alpha/beta fold hydrolase [Nocardia huaxiensis]UFS93059.1 alpha/beta fold hydrolase [Nocardia huaxiensis]